MYRRTWKLNILPNFFEPVFYLWSIGLGVGAYVSEMGGMPLRRSSSRPGWSASRR